jgi:hypothetical protein
MFQRIAETTARHGFIPKLNRMFLGGPSSTLTPRVGVGALSLNILFISTMFATAGCVHRSPSERGNARLAVERETREWPWPANATCLVVDHRFGDLHLRAGAKGRLAAHAVIQRIDPNLPRARIDLREAAGCVRVSVEIAGISSDAQRAWDTRRARMDLALALPPGIRVVATVASGSIDAKALDNDIAARSLDGGIALSGSGDFEVATRNGRVQLTARGERRDPRWRVRTQDGAIHAFLREDAPALEARTCGRIRDGFASGSMRARGSGCEVLRRGAAGAAAIELHSRRGDVELVRLES